MSFYKCLIFSISFINLNFAFDKNSDFESEYLKIHNLTDKCDISKELIHKYLSDIRKLRANYKQIKQVNSTLLNRIIHLEAELLIRKRMDKPLKSQLLHEYRNDANFSDEDLLNFFQKHFDLNKYYINKYLTANSKLNLSLFQARLNKFALYLVLKDFFKFEILLDLLLIRAKILIALTFELYETDDYGLPILEKKFHYRGNCNLSRISNDYYCAAWDNFVENKLLKFDLTKDLILSKFLPEL